MEEREFFDNLEERAINEDEKKGLTRNTSDAELAYIASRAEEAKAAAEAGEFGFTVEEAEAVQAANLAAEDELAEEEESAEEEPAEEPSGSAAGDPHCWKAAAKEALCPSKERARTSKRRRTGAAARGPATAFAPLDALDRSNN